MKISNEDKKLIKQSIVEAEKTTSGEILPVILSKSDNYPVAHFRLAIIFGLLAAFSYYYSFEIVEPLWLLWVEMVAMIVGYLLAFVPQVKRLMLTKAQMSEEVRQRAIEIYHENKVSLTKDRTGIMLYISLMERKVEVIADCGINEKVERDYWNIIVNEMISKLKSGSILTAIRVAIKDCSSKLTEHFPISKDDENEIHDDLITDL